MFPHEQFMRRCIELAALGLGAVSPNPMVGAVIVKNGRILSEGYHQKYGEAHAEVNALEELKKKHSNFEELLSDSTLYVSLEPCSHFGQTPPCADLIIKYRIPRVIVGCPDPNLPVNGKGIEKLRAAGIEVIEGVLRDECISLNKRFFTRVEKQRPYIILKWAQTADSFFAPADGSRRWISGLSSRQLVHRWRSDEDAVLVGKNTALADDPQLNTREWPGKNPLRIVIDRNLELPVHLNIFDQVQETVVFNSIKTEIDGKIKYLELENFDRLLPQLICYQLYLMDIQSIIIEGGARTLRLFIDAGLWDEARIFTGEQKWEQGIPAPAIKGELLERISVGQDTLEVIKNRQLV
jgi:diaminohydroxyphosphoribosylaminopyrimidine deaminase/5-amino-6-(5-phosphoribosylamino)uracil reductase